MKQLIYIGGGDCFRTEEDFSNALKNLRTYEPFKERKKRQDRLRSNVSKEYEIANPTMPNKFNARYNHRKIWFEKIFPYLNNESLVMIGYSL
jgi:hypothetical protein